MRITRLMFFVVLIPLMTVAWASEMPAIDIGMTVVKAPIVDKSMDEAVVEFKKAAKALNIRHIADSPLYKEFQAMGLPNVKRTEFFQFCNAEVAKALIEYSIDYAAFLPCRVALIEDKLGQGWFVMMNPAILTAQLPPHLQQQIAKTCGNLMKIIGATSPPNLKKMPKMDFAQLMVTKKPISEEVEIDEAIDSLKLRANELNVKSVAYHNLTEDYQKLGLPNIKRTEIFQFCDPRLGKAMLEHDISYSAYMPCRIALVEDETGKGWFIRLNLKVLIASAQLPPDLHKQAIQFSDKITEIVEAGANGEL
jgi:uncharacterized protein (DUF302 family)